MEYTTLHDILVCFLKKHNAYELYIHNLSLSHIVFVSLCKVYSTKPYEIIMDPFLWTLTKEGFAYWDELDTEWREILSRLI